MRRQKFYQISTSGRTADISIYGDITGDAELINALMETDTGAVSARSIVKAINALDVDNINVYINSYGGEVAEALAIYSALKRHSALVHTFCDGFACSAATIVFCAGDVRTMGSLALMMIHNCMSYLGYANSAEMRKAAEDNDKINQSSIEAYKLVSNLSEEEIRRMMDDATWMTAQECLKYGFATEVAEQEEDDADAEVKQSAFQAIRQAVLSSRQQVDADAIMRRLSKIEESIAALQPEPDPDPNTGSGVGDPNTGSGAGDSANGAPGPTPKEKASRFFESMFKKIKED